MQPKQIKIAPFSVTGVSVRTINSDEFNPTDAKLPALWGRFFADGVAEKVTNQVPGSPIFGVYSDYESDANGFYSVTAGVAASGPLLPEFISVKVQGGDYLVFENRGAMPQTVINTWVSIWAYFETSKEFTRSFLTDFEEYRGADEVAIHIGVRARKA